MTKRNLWSYEETLMLIEIIDDKKCLQKVEDKILHPNEIYNVIEQEMFSRGFYDKNAKQMRFRWQNLRKSYYKDRKMMENGADSTYKKSPYFEKLNNILSDRWSTRRKEENTASEEFDSVGNPLGGYETHNSSAEEDDDEESVGKKDMPAFEECFPTVPTPSKPRLVLKRPHSPDSPSKADIFEMKIKKITKELNDDLFKKQKELIEYEFRLFANYTSNRDEKFQEMMSTNTHTFLNGIKDLLQDKTNGYSSTKPKTERRSQTDDQNITTFFQSWDMENPNKKP